MKAKLATINLEVTDPERSKHFYVDLLGMVEDQRRSHAPSFMYLRSDGCDLTMTTFMGAPEARPAQTIELGFEVDDFPAMKAHLSTLGIADYREESMGWGDAIELRDPDGHRVIIYKFKQASAPGSP